MDSVQIIGRSSSHFTRAARIFALELGVKHELVAVYEPMDLDPKTFGGNPALKIPALRRDGSLLVGTENICRALAELAPAKRVVWPEELRTDFSRNAHELLFHAMAAQVQLAMGTLVNKLPAENPFFVKIRAGFDGALKWLDSNLTSVLAALPSPRDLSFFEVGLFCLLEHLTFRGTLPAMDYPALQAWAKDFAHRPSAQATSYRFDPTP